MNTLRILVIAHYHQATRLKGLPPAMYKRETAIWNTACNLAKGNKQFDVNAPKLCRARYVAAARKRLARLGAWADACPDKAAEICAPYIAEYERRAKARQGQEAVLA